MTDAANTRFTTDELLPYAQGNATAFVLATFAYLKQQGLGPGRRSGFVRLPTLIGLSES
jgi:hypothetical protein